MATKGNRNPWMLHFQVNRSGSRLTLKHNYAFDNTLGQIRSNYVNKNLQAIG